MHFVQLKPSWSALSDPMPQHLLELDKRQDASLNGDDGGTWNPAYPIVLGGAGVTLSTNSSFASVTGQTTPTGVVLVDGTAAISVPSNGTLNLEAVSSQFTLQSNAQLIVNGPAVLTLGNMTFDLVSSQITLTTTVGGPLDWIGFSPTFATGTTFGFATGSQLVFGNGSTWSWSGGITWNGQLALGQPTTSLDTSTPIVTRTGPWIVNTSTSTTAWRNGGATADGLDQYGISADEYQVPSLSDDTVYILVKTGALDGNLITFTHLVHGTTKAVTFMRGDGTTAAICPTTGPWWITFELRNGDWHAYAWGQGDSTMQSLS